MDKKTNKKQLVTSVFQALSCALKSKGQSHVVDSLNGLDTGDLGKLLGILCNHGLGGLYWNLFGTDLPKPLRAHCRESYQVNKHSNLVKLELLTNLHQLVVSKGLQSPLVLKGMALIGRQYSDLGVRPMSDIDLLIRAEDFTEYHKVLSEIGFNKIPTSKWQANRFKQEYSQEILGHEVVIELHSRLFYEQRMNLGKATKHPLGYEVLNDSELLFHQIVHLVYQHTFLNLIWLHDIHLLLCDSSRSVWGTIKRLATENAMTNSLSACAIALKRVYGAEAPEYVHELANESRSLKLFRWIDDDFLLNPYDDYGQYLLIKHSVKDSLWRALKYDVLWLSSKLKSRLS